MFDYLSDRVCKRLFELFCNWTRAGGLVLCTNVHPRNPARRYMEHILEWHLSYRDEADMMRLAPEGGVTKVLTDSTGTNVFLETRKG